MRRRFAGVIASDLDGTLFGSDHQLAAPTVDALRNARRAGWLVLGATGRAPRSAMERVGDRDVLDGLACSNGSIVHDVSTDTTSDRFPIDPAHLGALFGALDAGVADLAYCWEMASSYAWDADFGDIAREHDDLSDSGPGDRPGPDVAVTKVMVSHPDVVREELMALLVPHLPAPLTIGCSGVEFIEITGVGVNKARALAHLGTRFGFGADEVIAFGDNQNDVPMLEWAGHSVAVGNAVEAAKQVANEVIGDHSEHSVAAYIESLL